MFGTFVSHAVKCDSLNNYSRDLWAPRNNLYWYPMQRGDQFTLKSHVGSWVSWSPTDGTGICLWTSKNLSLKERGAGVIVVKIHTNSKGKRHLIGYYCCKCIFPCGTHFLSHIYLSLKLAHTGHKILSLPLERSTISGETCVWREFRGG